MVLLLYEDQCLSLTVQAITGFLYKLPQKNQWPPKFIKMMDIH